MRPTATLPPIAALVLLAALPAHAAPDQFGSWILNCSTDPMTDQSTCRMTHAQPVEPATEHMPALALEIAPRRGRLVPVVTARDLNLEGALRGLLALTGTAQLRFPPNPLFEMPCGLEGRSVVCAPRPEDAARAAEELPKADQVLVRVLGFGSATAESAPHELPLSQTPEALAAFRAEVPPEQADTPPPAFNLREMIQRLQHYFFSPQ
ncbi:hypothetical protein QMO56_00575 [Roseomonas sp. E05]|uniref:hypothetical protein n=1 Tax=Roseomonas sp. E05 TaxID=3046310 RepID=UPI0024B88064|nr:hypothetical protein [Roseomonas sp. E05]MDJ0386591.1 hypothetical protein [Roseomonas sp. E05]